MRIGKHCQRFWRRSGPAAADPSGGTGTPLAVGLGLGEVAGLVGGCSAPAAVLGSWIMADNLNRRQVNATIGVVLLGIAAKMVWDLASARVIGS